MLFAIGFKKIVDFDWLEPPHPETIALAVQDLCDWYDLVDNLPCLDVC